MKPQPLVSIVVSNYNYEQFISETIHSALNQSYQPIEVIVVDDGSTDRSRDVIASFGSRITSILKENGGQASAMNAGFAAANGEIVMFLDSDDVLLPDTFQRVVEAFQSMPDVAKVQYRLQIVDKDGKPNEEIVPAKHWAMPTGDLRQAALKSAGYIYPPTSGIVFSAAALQQIMPMPEPPFRVCADIYLNELSVLTGAIVSLDEVGAHYRVHGKNNVGKATREVHPKDMREYLARMNAIHVRKKSLVAALYPDLAYDPTQDKGGFLTARIISRKLDAPRHPYPNDNLAVLCVRGFLHNITMNHRRKHVGVLLAFWHLAMLLAPKPAAQKMANNLIYADSRGRLMNTLRKMVQLFG
ncbi:glycosyltransferase [Stenomitos frigidus]|uniref:Glycosyltransferase 2-like domain-containing protein n=1 Tax=Stenomitos frigidus ULC18 TaxID=2107698 RepID=A0A2T1DYP3_9CYAN|nr:glycosyltransferase [Stenomitos frigidus]PSB25602.1 hypothetical protein C7B82_22550 [Stenomitos frigidus ULC18]